jgi:hypothetical protein
MKAKASKHKAMGDDRMQKDEVRLRAEVEARLARADAEDAAEDAEDAEDAGPGQADPAAEIRSREERLAKMAAALEALRRETEAGRAARRRAQAEELRQKTGASTTTQQQGAFTTLAAKRAPQADALDTKRAPHAGRDDGQAPPAGPDDGLPHNTPPAELGRAEAGGAGASPPRRAGSWGATARSFRRTSAQIAVEEGHQIVVAAAVSNQAPGKRVLPADAAADAAADRPPPRRGARARHRRLR